jgi:hypothetical protein
MAARRENVTVRPMCDPQSRELNRQAPLWTFAVAMSTDAATKYQFERVSWQKLPQM